ncbi:MAG: hypothetical protein KBE16_08545, partial [Alphaproteobacteria bacterium]|nr:hypothetical protein [Alphaproteobacteria bacterium]
RIDLQRYTYTLLCNIELIPSKNRLAKLTVAFNTICILGEVNDYEGAFYSGNRFLNVMPRLSKSQVEVMGQVVTHLFQKLRKVGENSGKLVNEIYDGLFQFREGKKGLIQVIDLASPFISKDASIFRYLMTVAPSKREKVVTGLILLGDYPDLSKAVLGLSMVDEEEIEVIAQFLSFVSKIDQGNPYSLIENLLQFSSEMRESMIMFLKANFPQLRLEAFDLSSLLNFLNETPPSEWISSLVLARDLSGLLKRPVSDLCALHIILEGIDHRSIRTFFEMMSIKLEGTNAQYASFTYSASMPGSLSQRRQVVLKGLFNHPIERVEALLDKLKPFLENNLDYFSDLVDILSTLLTIEPENLSEAIDLICSSIKNLNNVSHSALMKSMTIVQLREFVPLLKCVLQSVTGRDIGVDNFVQVLENCNPEEKMYLLSAVLPYIPSLGIFGALKGLLSIPAAERVETLKLVLLYIDKETIHHESIFLALAKVPMIRRNHVMFIGQGPMGCIRNGALFYNFCEIFLKNIVLEDVEESLDALMDRLINDWRDQLRHNPDQEEIRRLAGCISRFAGDLGLNQEHEIVQLAIRTSILLLSANSDLKNPYNILQRLEAKRAEPMNWGNINPSIEILNGYSLSFNSFFFGSEMKEIVIRVGQLPKVSHDFIERHLSALKSRFATEEGLIDQVKELTGYSFENIEEKALADRLLARHLSFEGGEDAIVPIITARFIAIAAYIDTLSEAKNSGDDFSDQEMAFIKMLSSIMLCATGKSDGIGRYYLNVLPASCRYGQGAAPAPESRLVDLPHDQSKLVICEILAEEIEKMFSGSNAMMKRIVGVRGEIQEASHQGLYLRNLLGKDLFGSTKVYFDPYTELLYEHLVALDKQEAMQIFFTYFKPSSFVQLIAKKFDLDIGETVEEFVRIGLFRGI